MIGGLRIDFQMRRDARRYALRADCIHSSLNDWDGRNAALERRSVGLVCGQRGDVLIFPVCSRNTQVTSSDDDMPASPDGELPRNETRESIVYLFAPPLHSSENVENPQFCNSALFF